MEPSSGSATAGAAAGSAGACAHSYLPRPGAHLPVAAQQPAAGAAASTAAGTATAHEPGSVDATTYGAHCGSVEPAATDDDCGRRAAADWRVGDPVVLPHVHSQHGVVAGDLLGEDQLCRVHGGSQWTVRVGHFQVLPERAHVPDAGRCVQDE